VNLCGAQIPDTPTVPPSSVEMAKMAAKFARERAEQTPLSSEQRADHPPECEIVLTLLTLRSPTLAARATSFRYINMSSFGQICQTLELASVAHIVERLLLKIGFQR
jgi:hypothetical protein